ncbi:MAG TPA: farnesyl diphosphate synthase, partial [Caldimonas sp.]|nr:farnesyl diphosphate synthase [Caldimonas sp.]
ALTSSFPPKRINADFTVSSENSFNSRLNSIAADTETLLDRLMEEAPLDGERSRPKRLLDSIRYSSLGAGKRFRPFLVVESAALFGVPHAQALMVGAALECVHCYSLVHDDMPAMDNDDLRRGRPTTHKAFDDATAILAGDSLLTYAFDIVARPETHPSADVRVKLVMALARASGLGGMVGGQILDLAAEGRFADVPRPQTLADVETLQAMKTGALIRFGCNAGAILGQTDDARYRALDTYGAAVGQAFQIADDLLDIEGDTATVGKQTGKDAAAGKATIVGVLGIAKSKERLKSLVDEANSAVSVFGASAEVLKAAARFVAERQT